METTADMRVVGIVFIKIVCNVSGPPVLDINCEENFYETDILINCFDEVLYIMKKVIHTRTSNQYIYMYTYYLLLLNRQYVT